MKRKTKARRKTSPSTESPSQLELSIPETVGIAVNLHRRGKLAEAERIYRKVIELVPTNVDALHYLGVLSHQQGRSAQAVDLIRRALAIQPDYADAHNNLGNVFKEAGRFDEAERHYRQVIRLQADHADAYNNLGAVLRAQKQPKPAIEAFQRSVELRGDNPDSLHNLGNALRAADRLEEALTYYRRALEIDPSHVDSHLNLGRALYRFGRTDEAATVFRKWLEVEPNHPIAEHMLSACVGEDVPQRASDAFVQQTFDRFAGSFDEVLNRLEYRVPQLLADEVEDHLDPPAGELDVLDAGCGTGLCGPLLADYCRTIVGVDLSPGMLAKARKLGVYQDLVEAELTGFMNQHTTAYDLIVSADTLCYFGDLEEVVSAAAASLRSGGHLVFSVEQMPADAAEADTGFRLNPHGRYSHSQAYVERVLAQAHLTIVDLHEDTLRREANEPVGGLIVTVRKGS